MDIPRSSDIAKKKKRRRILFTAGGLILLLGITLGLSRLKPAAPSVERETVWIDTVKRGSMLRQVRGTGTLVPEQFQWIPATSQGRVDEIYMRPGKQVEPDTVIMRLSNQELEQETQDAELKVRAAEAEFINQKAKLEVLKMDQEAAAAKVKAEYLEAQLRAEADEALSLDGLVADITLKVSKAKAEESATRWEIEKRRLAVNAESMEAQIKAQTAGVDQVRALYQLKKKQLEQLQVKAGSKGVLQQLLVEVGQRVLAGATLAKVAQPEHLKAELRIAETQAKDILIGQVASIDTRNGLIDGEVSRIDPAVQNGTVTVDVSLKGQLPKGARPDLTVDGTIELERLTNVLYVGRPASGQEHTKVGLFRIKTDGKTAERTTVQLGRSSVNTIEILGGLKEGDQVVLSDMAAWDSFDTIRLN
ncbi:MAG TPA: HlyD family efflux transporter periplasmic adaptor subunit [Acidobacteriota bacterium]|nr:HlyD family efflux transporter periplasmic adaptor subunit [Acidobacteriota bacterium]